MLSALAFSINFTVISQIVSKGPGSGERGREWVERWGQVRIEGRLKQLQVFKHKLKCRATSR